MQDPPTISTSNTTEPRPIHSLLSCITPDRAYESRRRKGYGRLTRDAHAQVGDFFRREATRRFDRHRRSTPRTDLDRVDLEDAVGVHREADLDLRPAARSGREIA